MKRTEEVKGRWVSDVLEIARLRGALMRYGHHLENECRGTHPADGKCPCGYYDALLSAPPTSPEVKDA